MILLWRYSIHAERRGGAGKRDQEGAQPEQGMNFMIGSDLRESLPRRCTTLLPAPATHHNANLPFAAMWRLNATRDELRQHVPNRRCFASVDVLRKVSGG